MSNAVGQQLNEVLILMRTKTISLRQTNEIAPPTPNKNTEDEVDGNIRDNNIPVRSNLPGYFPDLDKVCRHLYLDLNDMMDVKNAKDWLGSFETLVRIMR